MKKKSGNHFKKLSEFKNLSFKVCTTSWIIAKGKELSNLAAAWTAVFGCMIHTQALSACFALPADRKAAAETE